MRLPATLRASRAAKHGLDNEPGGRSAWIAFLAAHTTTMMWDPSASKLSENPEVSLPMNTRWASVGMVGSLHKDASPSRLLLVSSLAARPMFGPVILKWRME